MTTLMFSKIEEGSVEIRYVTNDPTLTPFCSKQKLTGPLQYKHLAV